MAQVGIAGFDPAWSGSTPERASIAPSFNGRTLASQAGNGGIVTPWGGHHARVAQRKEARRSDRRQCEFESHPAYQIRVCSPTGRGNRSRACQVSVRIAPGAPRTVNRVGTRHPLEAGWHPRGCADQARHCPPDQRKANRDGSRPRLEPGWCREACASTAAAFRQSRVVNREGSRPGFETRWCPRGHGDQDLGHPP